MYECEHFQISLTSIFQSANEYDVNVYIICAKFKYISIEVCTTGFTRHLCLRRQKVNRDNGCCGGMPSDCNLQRVSLCSHLPVTIIICT
jgi:hypothetical protein